MKRTLTSSFRVVARLASGLALLPVLAFASGCTPTLAQPFAGMKNQPITIYRLQNYEQPAATAGAAAAGLPPQIQQWLTAGAQLLPPGLLPPGLLPGANPTAPVADAQRFHNFRILDARPVADQKQADEILELFGTASNFDLPRQSCMFAEFGFQFGQGSAMGTPAGGAPPADVLVSLSCDQVQLFNYSWPHSTKTGLTDATSKHIVALVQKTFSN